MTAPVNVLAIIDAERPLMAAASALTGVDTLQAHDAMRAEVAELLDAARWALKRDDAGNMSDTAAHNLEAALISAGGSL